MSINVFLPQKSLLETSQDRPACSFNENLAIEVNNNVKHGLKTHFSIAYKMGILEKSHIPTTRMLGIVGCKLAKIGINNQWVYKSIT